MVFFWRKSILLQVILTLTLLLLLVKLIAVFVRGDKPSTNLIIFIQTFSFIER